MKTPLFRKIQKFASGDLCQSTSEEEDYQFSYELFCKIFQIASIEENDARYILRVLLEGLAGRGISSREYSHIVNIAAPFFDVEEETVSG